MSINKRILVLIFMLISGCATQAHYANIVNSWIGSPEEDLIRAWGPPVNVYQAGSSKFIQYSYSNNSTIAGTAPTYTTNCYDSGYSTVCNTNKVGGTAPINITQSCDTTYEVKNGTVANVSFVGNGCVATEQ